MKHKNEGVGDEEPGLSPDGVSKEIGASRDTDRFGSMRNVPAILKAVAELTQMRCVVIAKVTKAQWLACAVLDEMEFGLQVGSELEVATTLCSEVRDELAPVVIGHASQDARYCNHPTPKKYGIESYIAVPIVQKNGEFFGTLCALDLLPTDLSSPTILKSMNLFAELIANELGSEESYAALMVSETKRRESENRIRAVTDAMPGWISYVDRDYRYQFVNRAYTDWFGLTAEELVSKSIVDVVGKKAFDNIRPHLDAAFKGETEVFEYEISHPRGGRRNIRATYTPDILDGHVRGLFVLGIDVTEEKLAQDAVNRSDERYKAFIQQSTEGIWRFELEKPILTNLSTEEQILLAYTYGYLAECNDAMAKQYGFSSASEIIGARLSDLLVQDDPKNIEFLRAFIESDYHLSEAESHEKGVKGEDRYFLNNFVGIVEGGFLLRAWGTQRDITETKLAGDATARLAAIVVSSEDAIISKDLMGNITSWNVGATKMFGYKAEDVIGKPITILMPPDRANESVDILRQIRREENIEHFETVRRRSDGTDIIVSLTVSPIRNAEGNVIGASKIVRDITDRKRIEETIHQNQAMLTLAMQSSRMGVWELDLATNTVSWSEELEEIFGLEKGSFGGTQEDFFALLHEDDRERVWNEIQDAIAENRDYSTEFRFHWADGSIRWMEGRGEAVYSQKGEPVRLYGVGIDITERKEAEKALRESEQRFSRFMQHLPGLAWIKDLDGRYVYANESAERSFGVWGPDLYGKTDDEIFPSETATQFRTHDRKAVESGSGGIQIAESMVQEDGILHHSIVSKFPIAGADGKPALIGGMAIDVTDQKQAEEALRKSEETYRTLFESIDEGYCTAEVIFDSDGRAIDYRFEQANPAFYSITGFPSDAVGRTARDLVPNLEQHWVDTLGNVALTGIPQRFENEASSMNRWFDIYVSRIGGDDSHRVVVVVNNITERKRREANLAFFADWQANFSSLETPEEIVGIAGKMVSEYLNLDHTLLVEIDKETTTATVLYDHRSPGAPELAGTYTIRDFHTPAEVARLEAGLSAVINNLADGGRSDAAVARFNELGIGSIISSGYLSDGQLRFVLASVRSEPHEWRPDEIEFTHEFASRIYARIERARAESALRDSEVKYRALFDSMDEGYCIIEIIFDEGDRPVDYLFVEVNSAFERQAGMHDVTGKRMLEFVDDIEPHWLDSYGRVAKTGEPIRFANEYRSLHRWFDVYAFRPTDAAKNQVAVLFTDITSRVRAEEKIRESEARFRTMADNAPVMIWVTDATGHCTFLSQSWYDYTGQNPESGLGYGWLDALHPEDRVKAEKDFREANEKCERFNAEYRFANAAGEYHWAIDSAQPRFDTSGNYLGYIGSVVDIHERKLAEDAIVRAERKAAEEYQILLGRIVPLAATLGRSRDLTTIYRAVREFISASMKCSGFFVSFFEAKTNQRLAAYVWGEGSEVDIAALPPMTLQPKGGGANSRAVFEKKTIIMSNYWDDMKKRPHLILSENGIDPMSSLIVPMMIKDEVLGTLEVQAHENDAFHEEHAVALEMAANLAAVAIENVRLIETEAAAREAAESANRAKDEFLSVLSHELRTPLNAMLGWVRMLKAGVLDEENSERALEVIERNTRLQSSLIEDLLDVSRIISGKMRIETELVDLVSVVQTVSETTKPLADAKDITFEFARGEEAVFLNADPVRLQQVVSNLLQNSIKFTPAGGNIDITLERDEESAILAIRDTGVGIETELLPHIFDRFRQADASARRNFTGLGLGLTIVRNIVELHGGTVDVASDGKDRGSVFKLTLPPAADFYTKPDAREEEQSIRASSGSLSGQTILLVDDDSENLLPLKLFLENENADVTPASSATEALGFLAKQDFNLMITDIGMPEIDGYELVTRLRSNAVARNSALNAIALTAYASVDDRERALRAGFQAHLAKPVNFDELLSIIKKVSRNGH